MPQNTSLKPCDRLDEKRCTDVPQRKHISSQLLITAVFSLAKSTFLAKSLHSQTTCQSSMLVLHMIICPCLLLTAVDALTLKKYAATIQEKEDWPRFIYRSIDFNRKPFVRYTISFFCMQSWTKGGPKGLGPRRQRPGLMQARAYLFVQLCTYKKVSFKPRTSEILLSNFKEVLV